MPILFYDSQDAVPEDVRDAAAEIKDGDNKGKWQVNLVSRKSLEKFRDNNTELANKLKDAEDLVGKFKGVAGGDPTKFNFDEFTAALAELRETDKLVKDGKVKKSEEIEAIVRERMEIAIKNHGDAVLELNQRLAAEKQAREKAEKDLDKTYIDAEVRNACLNEKLGVHPSAVGDIIQRAYAVYTVEKDKSLVPLDKHNQIIRGEDGVTPRTVQEWLEHDVRKNCPHYFKQSQGGGAGGGDGNKSFGGLSKEEFNKLSPDKRLAIINAQNPAGRVK